MNARILALVACSAFVGCGGADDRPAPDAGRANDECDGAAAPAETACGDARPVRCVPGEPREALEASELVDLPVDEAQSLARRHGCVFRVVKRDGEDLVVTQDFRTDRVNVAVVDGWVVRVLGVY